MILASWVANTPHHILPDGGGMGKQRGMTMNEKWTTYEQLKAQLRVGKITPEQYEKAVKELVRRLKL